MTLPGLRLTSTGFPWRGRPARGAMGRSRFFRYGVQRWRDGVIPDMSEAVASPQQLSADRERAQRVLDLAGLFPTNTWGRDQLHTGEMWNSNSLTSWLLASSAHRTDDIEPPPHGRAPGWSAGLVIAARESDSLREGRGA